jgi:hypothetical protein
MRRVVELPAVAGSAAVVLTLSPSELAGRRLPAGPHFIPAAARQFRTTL